MLAGLTLWGSAYVAFVLAISRFSTPAHKLPGYFLFEVCCLIPWTLWLLRYAVRTGTVTAVSAVVQSCVVMAVTYPVHIVSTHRLFWGYFQDRDTLLGIRLAGVPFEEYLFYPLTINFAILLYLLTCEHMRTRGLPDLAVNRKWLRRFLFGLAAIFFAAAVYVWSLRDPAAIAQTAQTWDSLGTPHYADGPREYGWTIVCLISVGFNLLLLYLAECGTPMMLRAVLPVIAIFTVMCLLIDLLGISRGWWVFNSQQASGLMLGGAVPAENLPSYVTGVTLSIAAFEACRRLMGDKRRS